ncbi:Glycosyltransferase involved in cell wall bisynthesis [Micromonospora sediminicola]|uniref:Glycosyltransferase involved in cell wall bisynthesis n=1 Tax=Micromonospora sediminicola TaxID=946078 RepID=A0A1A9B2A6_9ACTN|nr:MULTISPECIES: glycosyltransferase family 4 protein [Micromonospora]PGH41796.1 glycosyl transferase family 1 [Micromonospora sp. WMMA1996]SBT63630.1 Glycosyltransferase involved in cell wall bisynthesis [Micromonospora sediminicola]
MRIVVAHNRYREAQPSGENTIVDAEIAELTAAGVEVLPFLRSSDEIPSMSRAAKALLPISPIWAPKAQHDLDRLLTEHRPDVLHLHNPYPLLSPWVVRTAHRHDVPVVQTVHNYRQVCSSGLYFRDGVICQDCRGRALGVPAVVHRCYRNSRAQSALMATTLAVHRPTWKSVDRFIALTTAVADHLRDYGIPDERIVVKPNAVPDPGTPAPVGNGFLFMGRLSPEKGLDLLLAAWRRHPVGTLGPLRIAGDGELRPLAEEAAAERPDIHYLGQLDRAGVRAALADSSVVLATSTWHDVLPTVIIEALAAGRPVLGTALGGIPYLVGADTPREPAGTGPAEVATAAPGDGRVALPSGVQRGEAGWVVAPEVEALAAALPLATAEAPVRAGAARSRYERTFHPDVITKRLIDIYAGLAGRRLSS